MFKRLPLFRASAAAILMTVGFASVAQGQNSLERFNRQLDQLRLDNAQQPAKDVPIGQRVLLDYGGYFTYDYLSIDDSV